MIAPAGRMDNRRLQSILERETRIVEGRSGFWRIEYGGRTLLVITDETHDRMRVMTPVAEESQLQEDEYRRLLAANFDRALDAKFAISDDVVWSLFVHPLGDLTESFLIDALEQVKTLADNFGGSYSSSELKFGG